MIALAGSQAGQVARVPEGHRRLVYGVSATNIIFQYYHQLSVQWGPQNV